MKRFFYLALLLLLPFEANAAVVYTQAPAGGLLQSSRMEPNGSDYDQYVWDNFTLSSNKTISKIRWTGGYDPLKFGSGGPVIDFSVAIYASIPVVGQPDRINPPLAQYLVGGNAGETQNGSYYNYQFILPTPFAATAGTEYWVQIEAYQNGIPDWGIAGGSGGDGKHFRRTTSINGDILDQVVSGDAAFTLNDANNSAPVANAGPDQAVAFGTTVTLNGSASSDADGDPLTYAWAFVSQPTSSLALLSDATVVNPTFMADRAGTYVVQLIVNDGLVNSGPDTVIIRVSKDELVLNYGSAYGLWHYDQARGWQQWNTVNPSQMATVDLNFDGTDELVAAFPGYGLFTYDSTSGWQLINTIVPEIMGAFRNGIVCNYGVTYGLWLWDLVGGWQQINTVKPDMMIAVDIDGDGQDELVAGFTGYGLYSYANPGVWTQINTVIPNAMVRHSHGLVCDYGAVYGLWHYDNTGGWKQWNTVNPSQMVTVDLNGDGVEEIVAAYPGYGLYTYGPVAGNWQQINTVIPNGMMCQANSINFDYGTAYGLWNWSEAGGWVQRNTAPPGRMIAADINRDGAEELVAVFVGYGLYYFDQTAGWQMLNAVVPNDMEPVKFYR